MGILEQDYIKDFKRCKIISKDYFINKVVERFLINGEVIEKSRTIVVRKPAKALSHSYDRLVFKAIHKVGTEWSRVQNYLTSLLGTDSFPGKLETAINRHTIL